VALCCGGDSTPDDAASRLGLPADLVEESETYQACDGIYPDNLPTVSVFLDMLTQWRVGAGGATGLDYTALPVVMRIREVRRENRQEIFDGIQVMERAALKGLRESRR
jgi:hypothetical protein